MSASIIKTNVSRNPHRVKLDLTLIPDPILSQTGFRSINMPDIVSNKKENRSTESRTFLSNFSLSEKKNANPNV